MNKFKFKTDGFEIIPKACDPKVANFVYQYLILREQVTDILFKTGYIAPSENLLGRWDDIQVPGAFSLYADVAMEILLLNIKPKVEKISGLKLHENYSYSRLYKKGNVLKKHKDRFSCEISTTLNLGGDKWPIYIETNKGKEIEVNLKPGDMLLYKGNNLSHWRNPLQGIRCGQVFLHYNNVKTKGALKNKYDGRPHLGLPDHYIKGE
jgi:hypothetical protein